jgi:hypothetical protein
LGCRKERKKCATGLKMKERKGEGFRVGFGTLWFWKHTHQPKTMQPKYEYSTHKKIHFI